MGSQWRKCCDFAYKAITSSCFFFLMVSARGLCNDFSEFNFFQKKLSKEYVTSKISRYLQYSNKIEDHFKIQEDALLIFASAEDKEKNICEYRLFFGGEESIPPPARLAKSLDSVKIAIDPGHFGGKWAELEERYIDLEFEGRHIRFDEGTLAFLTAAHLKEKLEEKGARVFLTRKQVGEGAYPQNFFDWLKGSPQYWKKDVALSAIFLRHYNPLDLKERAKAINAFKPDLTVVIHYNAGEDAKAITPIDQNFNLIFIPGAFCGNELVSREDRLHFLRLICTQDLEISKNLARILLDEFSKQLGVPPFKESLSNTLSLGNGIFSRNLCLTRYVRGPVCYGETLIQNNKEELIRLAQESEEVVAGISCPKRVIEVANAYYDAIVSFLNSDFDPSH